MKSLAPAPAPAPAPGMNDQAPPTFESGRYEDVVARAMTYALRLLPREEARELAHDVAVELVRSPDASALSGPVVYLAVTRRLRNAIRAARRRSTREQAYLQSNNGTPAWVRPDADLEARELRDRLRDAVAEMPASMREIFLLLREQEVSYKEVADRLGVSVGTVHTQLSRAAARLRECVRRYEAGEPSPSKGASR
jgi:RNA polymerase sigma factor (sigma-70 family)